MQEIRSSKYHSGLRIAVVVFALILVFDSGLLTEKTAGISAGAQHYVAAAVGVRVGVAPNEFNTLTGRITELEQELAAKDREIVLAKSIEQNTGSSFDTSTFVLSIILFILLVLIVLNYVLDYLRIQANRSQIKKTSTA
jgi:hypothetical protein